MRDPLFVLRREAAGGMDSSLLYMYSHGLYGGSYKANAGFSAASPSIMLILRGAGSR